MKTVLTIIFIIILGFDCLMATPFGLWWFSISSAKGKPCLGYIIAFGTAIPLVIIGCFLGIIK